MTLLSDGRQLEKGYTSSEKLNACSIPPLGARGLFLSVLASLRLTRALALKKYFYEMSINFRILKISTED